MRPVLDIWCYLTAAFGLAVAGVFELIDQNTMITLMIVLTVCMPGCRRACVATRGTVA